MNIQDIYTLTFLSGILKNFQLTGYPFIDTLIIGILSFVYFLGDTEKIKNYLENYSDYIFEGNCNKYKITATKGRIPITFKSILWYISNNKNDTIKYIEQFTDFGWDNNDNKIEKSKCYIINQIGKFQITNDIYGKMEVESKEHMRGANGVEYRNIYNLVLYSKTKRLDEIIEWLDIITKDFRKYMKLKTVENQLLLSVSYQDELMVEPTEFDSSATFENTYVPNYDEIINKINFFLQNKEWYDRKGIPYNLGIMLYGEPGCGKTRFIKQLMNHTNRHGIDIKLSNKFSFDELKKVIHNEAITDEYIIPQEKRIIIFEDIDAMCETLKDRDLIESENETKNKNKKTRGKSKSEDEGDVDEIIIKSKPKFNNNNLSYFLNIIDGLNECSGRIIVMTTNKIDYLDKAIIRPGRIDIKINFAKYELKDVCGIINKFWGKKYNIEDLKKEVDKKYTSAEIISIFRTSQCFNDIKDLFINKLI